MQALKGLRSQVTITKCIHQTTGKTANREKPCYQAMNWLQPLFTTNILLFVEANNLLCFAFKLRMYKNNENRMSWNVKGRNYNTHGSGSQIHLYRREVLEQGGNCIRNEEEEEIAHQLYSIHMSFSLGIPQASGVSLHFCICLLKEFINKEAEVTLMMNWRNELKKKEITRDKVPSPMLNSVPFLSVTNSGDSSFCLSTTYRSMVKAEINTQASSSLGVFGERFRFSRRKIEYFKLAIFTQYKTLSKITNQRLLESKNI